MSLVEGDEVEVRGPFASYFVWRGESPVLLVGGGSGVVPLMAMLRHRRLTMPELPMRLIYSVRTSRGRDLRRRARDDAVLTFTRSAPRTGQGTRGRLDQALMSPRRASSFLAGLAFICGSNGFVEAASELLLEAGFEPRRIRTERFGPTG